jgi:myosin-1
MIDMLEKSRITGVAKGERNFHIFYQLLAGLEPNELDDLNLNSDPAVYSYLNKSNVYKVDGTNDVFEFQKTKVLYHVISLILFIFVLISLILFIFVLMIHIC